MHRMGKNEGLAVGAALAAARHTTIFIRKKCSANSQKLRIRRTFLWYISLIPPGGHKALPYVSDPGLSHFLAFCNRLKLSTLCRQLEGERFSPFPLRYIFAWLSPSNHRRKRCCCSHRGWRRHSRRFRSRPSRPGSFLSRRPAGRSSHSRPRPLRRLRPRPGAGPP